MYIQVFTNLYCITECFITVACPSGRVLLQLGCCIMQFLCTNHDWCGVI